MTDEAAVAKARQPRAAIVLLAVAAAATWAASQMTWAEIAIADGLGGGRTVELDGNQWASAPTVLAVVLLAAIGAAVALSGWARRVLGVVLALIGAGSSIPAIVLLMGKSSDERATRLAELPARAEVQSIDWMRPAGLVAFAAAVAVFVAGGLLARKLDPNAGLSSRFSRDADAEDDLASERSLWAALDAGYDPTAEAPSDASDGDADYADRNPHKGVPPGKDGLR